MFARSVVPLLVVPALMFTACRPKQSAEGDAQTESISHKSADGSQSIVVAVKYEPEGTEGYTDASGKPADLSQLTPDQRAELIAPRYCWYHAPKMTPQTFDSFMEVTDESGITGAVRAYSGSFEKLNASPMSITHAATLKDSTGANLSVEDLKATVADEDTRTTDPYKLSKIASGLKSSPSLSGFNCDEASAFVGATPALAPEGSMNLANNAECDGKARRTVSSREVTFFTCVMVPIHECTWLGNFCRTKDQRRTTSTRMSIAEYIDNKTSKNQFRLCLAAGSGWKSCKQKYPK